MSSERYRDLELIAQGGMGEVFRATMVSDAGVEKRVALKLLDEDVGDGFLEEAKIAMAMSHGNIVQTFDAGHREGRPFLAMELVEGTDLTTVIAQGPIPPPHALTIAVEVLRGLEYAHRLRSPSGAPLDVVHRDISPSNILISRDGEVKIADFGIARTAAQRQQERGIRGKLAYMAPEQLSGAATDARADLYALGVVLHEMLEGKRPEVERGASGEFAAIVARAMDADAARRFASAAEMREAIEEAALAAELRLSTSALRDWLGTSPVDVPATDFDARLGAMLGGPARTGTVEVVPESEPPVESAHAEVAEPASSTRSYTLLVVAGLLVAAAMPFVGFAFDRPPARVERSSREVETSPPPEANPDERVDDDGDGIEIQRVEVERVEDEPVARPPRMTRMRASMNAQRVEPTTAVAAQPDDQAELWIASDPWAYVSIDGMRVGRTTLRGYGVAAGRHEVVLSNPSAGLQRRIDVDLRPGERKRLSVSLDE